jgi:hypothetical protein
LTKFNLAVFTEMLLFRLERLERNCLLLVVHVYFHNCLSFCFLSLVWPSNAAFSLSAYVHLVSCFMLDNIMHNVPWIPGPRSCEPTTLIYCVSLYSETSFKRKLGMMQPTIKRKYFKLRMIWSPDDLYSKVSVLNGPFLQRK